MKDMTDNYKRVVMLDTLKNKGVEAALVHLVEALLAACPNKDVKHLHAGGFHALWESIEGISH